MIELGEKKYIKAGQRKKLNLVNNYDDLYKTVVQEQDDSIFSAICKRGPQESIEEEYQSRQIMAPFTQCLPKFKQQQQHYNQLQTRFSNQEEGNFPITQIQSNPLQSFELSEIFSENYEDEQEYKIIQVDDLEQPMTFQFGQISKSKKINKNQKKILTPINDAGIFRKSTQI